MHSPKNAVVLVPVGGTIVPDCDRAFQVLQGRGYEVRTVRGFSQMDVGRCQMATDALGSPCIKNLRRVGETEFRVRRRCVGQLLSRGSGGDLLVKEGT